MDVDFLRKTFVLIAKGLVEKEQLLQKNLHGILTAKRYNME